MLFKMSPEMENCLFSAVGMQLEGVGIQLGERNLRAELVEHLQSRPYTHGSSHLRESISAPVMSDDPFNADTEAPTQQMSALLTIKSDDGDLKLLGLNHELSIINVANLPPESVTDIALLTAK